MLCNVGSRVVISKNGLLTTVAFQVRLNIIFNGQLLHGQSTQRYSTLGTFIKPSLLNARKGMNLFRCCSTGIRLQKSRNTCTF
ncbi:hypothetical protein OESDEN_06054 [Oesophagostomum dentatum]|uniref:Uncharacterized protein n=1 Tax=Oesophagostomum dentatum TaxID=61180 RepID=A0A0B1T8X7_OESDE|nr:hypothetical protein OESDEN_06054 [Oesophagostomum dentatum]